MVLATNDSLQQSDSAIKVLLIEDSETDCMAYNRYLQADPESRYQIVNVDTLQTGMEVWQSQAPDLALIDVNLPDGDGLEFLEFLHTLETDERFQSKLPVIILTGQGNERLAVQAMQLGAMDYLIKGEITASSLQKSILKVIEYHTLARQFRQTQQQKELLSALALRISQSLDLSQIFQSTVDGLRQLLGCDRTIIYQFQPDGSGHVIVESVNTAELSILNQEIIDPCFTSKWHASYRQGRCSQVNDRDDGSLIPCYAELLASLQVQANLVVPVLQDSHLWGLLIAHECHHPRAWESSNVRWAQQLATQVAIAIQQASAYTQLRTELRERQQAEIQLQELNQELEDRVEQRTAALKQSEAQLQFQADILQDIYDAVVATDQHGVIESWNRGAERIFGYSAAEVLGQSIAILYDHPEDLATVIESLLTQQHHEAEVTCRSKSGKLLEIYLRLSLTQDQEGNILRLVGISTDITAQKQAEQDRRQQADREHLLREITQRIRQSLDLKTIFDTACDEIRQMIQADRVGIFQFYPDSNFDDGEFVAESVVAGFSSVLKVRVHDHCFGSNYAKYYAQGKFFAVDDIYNSGLQTCHSNILGQLQVRANLVMPLLCGDALWGLLCVHQCGSNRQWQAFEINLTNQLAIQLAIAIQQANLVEQLQQQLAQRQLAQAQLTERNQQLAESNEALARATRLKDEFLANMSHELRTPLNAILGMTEGLQDEVFGIVNDAQVQALKTIEQSGNHLLSLINDILDVAKIESGQMELDCQITSVQRLCDSSVPFIKQQAFKKNIQLETFIPLQLPNLYVDELRIRQVLINLLSNAVKFTPIKGRITLQIFLESQNPQLDHQDSLRFTITDTGIGINPANLGKLFQPFIQIDSALNRQHEGTGLGLVLVKRIVELHGGYVEVSSEEGVGSCFSFILPTADPITLSHPSYPGQEGGRDTHNFSVPNHSPMILLAEDNDANLTTMSAYLKAKGYRLLIARDGETAVSLAQSESPDLILMDIQMPKVDGLEAIRRIRADENLTTVPIIALTALAKPTDQERCLLAGANHYLSKPVKLKQLVEAMQQWLPKTSV